MLTIAIAAPAPAAYLLITTIDLREGLAALRARHPSTTKLLKALAHALLFLKVLLA